MASLPANRIVLSDADVPDGVPIRVDAWDGPYARIVYRGRLGSGKPGFHHVLVSRERAVELLHASKHNLNEHIAFNHSLTRTRARHQKLWLSAQRPRPCQGRSREVRRGPTRQRGSRRAVSRSSGGGSSGDPDSSEPPGLAARGLLTAGGRA